MTAERKRLFTVAALTVISMATAGLALWLELSGGDGRRVAMLAGAPLLGAVLLVVLGGKRP